MNEHEKYPDTHHDAYSRTTFGFWLYLLTDFILFGTLFATYAVLQKSTFGGYSAFDLFDHYFTLIQTLILLTASFTAGLAGAFAHRRNKNATLLLFAVTFLLGIIFMVLQFKEVSLYLERGASWDKSAFLSAYFTIIGTFWVHMIFALLWILVLAIPALREGITPVALRRFTCLKMFWQFLNILWVFIFSFIYLMGVT
jgi:cytochrome o ubiquinol oxidase subunit 3